MVRIQYFILILLVLFFSETTVFCQDTTISNTNLEPQQKVTQSSFKEEKKIDSLNQVKKKNYKIFFNKNVSLYSDSIYSLKKNISYNYLKDSLSIFYWDSRTNFLVSPDSTLVTYSEQENIKDTIQLSPVEKKMILLYQTNIQPILHSFYNYITTKIFFYFIVYIILVSIAINIFFRKYSNNLRGLSSKLLLYSVKNFRDFQKKNIKANIFFNFNFMTIMSFVAFINLEFYKILPPDSKFYIRGFFYIFFLLVLSYVLKYLLIFLSKLFIKYNCYDNYKNYNFYFNKHIGMVLLPVALLLILFFNTPYISLLLTVFDYLFFAFLFFKLYFLLKITLKQFYGKKIVFILLYFIGETANILFWWVLFILPQTHYLSEIKTIFNIN